LERVQIAICSKRQLSVCGLRIREALGDVSSMDRFRYASDSDDCDCVARSPDEPFYVVRIACENRSFLAKGRRHHNGVNDIRRSSHA
jgi:hypothetical protein